MLLQALVIVSSCVAATCMVVAATVVGVIHFGGERAIRILQALGLAPTPVNTNKKMGLEQTSLEAQKAHWRGK